MVNEKWSSLLKTIIEFKNEINLNHIKSKKIILFGAGTYGNMVLNYFRDRHVPIEAFCDNDTDKWNKKINGLDCLPPMGIKNFEDSIIIITGRHYVDEISIQLKKTGIDFISFDKYFVCMEIDKIKKIYEDYLFDDVSKDVYYSLIKSMFTGNNDELIFDDNQYFTLPEFIRSNDETFVDCGAYVGNTIERFIWSRGDGLFNKIYAFEPGEKQFKSLKIRVNRLIEEWALDKEDIKCIPLGLGDKAKKGRLVNYSNQISASQIFEIGDGQISDEINICTLDDFFKTESDYENVSMIKMDVEGSEMKVIEGAVGLLKSKKPKLAICIYHKPTDIIDIPMFIKEIIPEYNIAIRHHSRILSETVLYCWK